MTKQKVKEFPTWVIYQDEGGQLEVELLSREDGYYIARDRDCAFRAYDHQIIEIIPYEE